MWNSEILKNLRKTIELDPTYFAKAKSDKNINRKPEVNQLLDEIEQKAKTRAKNAIAEAETSFSRAPKIRSNAEQAFRNLRGDSVLKSKTTYDRSKTKYKDAQNILELAKSKVASGEYIVLLEAKQIAEESLNIVNESYRLVNSAIDIATNEEERAIQEEKQCKKAKTDNIIETILYSPLLLIKAYIVGMIGLIIGAVIGGVIGLSLLAFVYRSNEYYLIEKIGGICAIIGFIIMAILSLICDVKGINEK